MSFELVADGHLPVSVLLRVARGETPPPHATSCEDCARKVRVLTLGAGELRGLQSALSTRRPPRTAAGSPVSLVAAAERIGREILIASAADVIEVDLLTRAYVGDPSLPAGILYALQGAAPLVAKRPALAGDLAAFIIEDWLKFPSSKPGALKAAIKYEALLLLSQVRLMEGKAAEAERIARGRVDYIDEGIPDIARARALYFHASALSALGKANQALDLFAKAIEEFRALDAPSWVGKTEAATGLALSQEADNVKALDHFDRALELLDPELDAHNVTGTLLAKGVLLGNLGRREEARAVYARALAAAVAGGFTARAIGIRVNLLGLAIEDGRYREVTTRGPVVLERAEEEGLQGEAWYCRLFLAEAQAASGNLGAMHWYVEQMLKTVPASEDSSKITALLQPIAAADRDATESLRRLRAYLSGDEGEERAAR